MSIFSSIMKIFGVDNTVPVLLAGMWPAKCGVPDSGTLVSLIEKEGGPFILQGYSDEAGEFRGRLPSIWIGKKLFVVVREVGFIYKYFNPVKIERWGLFLAIHQEKDRVYSGSKGAKSIDPEKRLFRILCQRKNTRSIRSQIECSIKPAFKEDGQLR